MNKEDIAAFLKYYLKLNLKLSVIDKSKNDSQNPNFKEQYGSYLKVPTFNINSEDDLYLLEANNDYTGIGLLLDKSSLVCIDLDYCLSELPIKKALSVLGLPKDYEWVIRTGSGTGFHIIADCDYEIKKDSIVEVKISSKDGELEVYTINSADLIKITSFRKADINSFRVNEKHRLYFEKIELLRFEHSLLPPSLHKSGRTYSFFQNELPSSYPKTVKASSLFDLISEFCLEENFIKLLEASNKKLSIPPHIIFSEDLPENNLTLIFDIKTTGLISESNYFNVGSFPEIIQVAWLITNGKDIIHLESSLNSEVVAIPSQITKQIKIDTKKCQDVGRPLTVIADMLIEDLNKVNAISAYNLDFNLQCLKNIFFRTSRPYDLKARIPLDFTTYKRRNQICLMKYALFSKDKIDGYNNDQLLELRDLCSLLFPNINTIERENSITDVLLSFKIFKILFSK